MDFDPRTFVLALDYDGTLAPLKPKPHLARLDAAGRRLLRRLRRAGFPVVLVSGRDTASLARVSGLPRFPMVGVHGFEARNLPGFRPASPAAVRRHRALARRLYAQALREFREPGLYVERKPFSLGLHWRGAGLSAEEERRLQARFRRWVRAHAGARHLAFQEGKKILEAKPRGFDKGAALRALRRRFPGRRLLYAGDDRTDLHAFRALRRGDLAVGVGSAVPPRLCDRHFPSPASFKRWLSRLARGRRR